MYQQYDKGWDATALGTDEVPGSNGTLHYPGKEGPFVRLWIFDVSTDFGLAGTTGQSRKTRSFFPHNSIPPQITVQCQAPNQAVYGRTIEFIRTHQVGLQTAYLSIPVKGITRAGYGHRGVHRSLSAEGYVQAVRRRHERFVYAPEFTFTFVVAKMAAPYKDQMVPVRRMKTWANIIDELAKDPKTGFAESPDSRPQGPVNDEPEPDRPGNGAVDYTKGPGRPD